MANVKGVKYWLSFIKSIVHTSQVLCPSILQYLILPQDGNIHSDLKPQSSFETNNLVGFHSALLFSVLEVRIIEIITFK